MEDLLLLVEDDVQLGQTLKDYFESNGLFVIWEKDGEAAIQLLEEICPRLILLDVILPRKNGFEVAAKARKINAQIPIIFMTGTALEGKDYIQAFQLLHGINYIEKPLNPFKTLTQIKGILHSTNIREYGFNNRQISIEGQHLIIDDKEFLLREKEIQIFSLLLKNLNSTVARKDILHMVWDDDGHLMNNALDSAISHIKKALKDLPGIKIGTIYGIGYKLTIRERK